MRFCWFFILFSVLFLTVDFVVAVNNYNLKVNIVLDKNGTACQTGVLEVVLDGMSVNMRHFPRRVPLQTPTPVANGPSTAGAPSTDGNTPSRQSQQ